MDSIINLASTAITSATQLKGDQTQQQSNKAQTSETNATNLKIQNIASGQAHADTTASLLAQANLEVIHQNFQKSENQKDRTQNLLLYNASVNHDLDLENRTYQHTLALNKQQFSQNEQLELAPIKHREQAFQQAGLPSYWASFMQLNLPEETHYIGKGTYGHSHPLTASTFHSQQYFGNYFGMNRQQQPSRSNQNTNQFQFYNQRKFYRPERGSNTNSPLLGSLYMLQSHDNRLIKPNFNQQTFPKSSVPNIKTSTKMTQTAPSRTFTHSGYSYTTNRPMKTGLSRPKAIDKGGMRILSPDEIEII